MSKKIVVTAVTSIVQIYEMDLEEDYPEASTLEDAARIETEYLKTRMQDALHTEGVLSDSALISDNDKITVSVHVAEIKAADPAPVLGQATEEADPVKLLAGF